MSKINVLSFEIANLIAAGEVVERPSSVLKELIENSIDSGATSIIAEIKRGGVSLIRVTDNGCGIEKDDLPIALKRHATSKIREKSDLDSIMTLGFRGEALAAISSVSTMTIISKTKNADSATMLIAEGGRIVDVSEVGASDGTTVVVEKLFENVPARRKFLKKDATEAMNVAALVEKVAVSHPEISIQLLIDGEERFKTSGDSELINAIYSVFGKEFANKTIKVDGTANGIRVHGYIGRSDNVKKNRNLQNVFINGRYVKSMTAMAAIEKAYTSFIAPECFPTCVLFIDINPNYVDVNVHPAKLEVKFSDERAVFESVYYTVKSALEDYEYRPVLELSSNKKSDRNHLGAFVPIGADTKGDQIKISESSNLELPKKTAFDLSAYLTDSKKHGDNSQSVPGQIKERYVEKDKSFYVSSPTKIKDYSSYSDVKSTNRSETMSPIKSVDLLKRYNDAPLNQALEESNAQNNPSYEKSSLPEYKLVGEVFDCYIIVEYDGAMLVIDKHAAHERILFEDLKFKNKNDGRIVSQTLLLPVTVLLTATEISTAREFESDLKSVGFDFTLNDKSVDILAIPDAISVVDAETLFVKMLNDLEDGKGNPALTEEIRREKALYQIACKAAIKGGRIYNKAIIEWLVNKVIELPDITVCPHGRPIAYKLTKNELDRQFDRIK